MINVLIADDHTVVRRGLRQILEEAPDMTVTGEASTGQDVLKALRREDYDVLVLDISMPDGGGLEVLNQLHDISPDLPVLILSIHGENQYAARAFRAGAAGYLTKDRAPEELITAIRRLACGGKYITRSLATTLANRLGKKQGTSHEILSDREFQVMCLLASGLRITDIAEDLSLSAKTVSTFRTRILEKLNLKTTADIIRYALEHDLVE